MRRDNIESHVFCWFLFCFFLSFFSFVGFFFLFFFPFNLRVTDIFNPKGKKTKTKKPPNKKENKTKNQKAPQNQSPTPPPTPPPVTEMFLPRFKRPRVLQLNAKVQHGKPYVSPHRHTYISYMRVCGERYKISMCAVGARWQRDAITLRKGNGAKYTTEPRERKNKSRTQFCA